MPLKSLDEYIVVTPDIAFGKPRIAGHRITVQDIMVWHELMGMSPDEIADGYDLTPSEIYAALAYYFDHREEIDQRYKEGQAFAEEMRKQYPSKIPANLAERSCDAGGD